MINYQEALHLLVASRDDPVTAAWAAVCHEYKVSARSEVSPYDAWEAYQDLFTLGAISSATFDNTDVKREFFSGRRPSYGAIQDALDNLLIIPRPEPGMEPMAKLGSPFESKTALAPRQETQQISRRNTIPLSGTTQLGASQLTPTSLAPRQEIAPAPSGIPTQMAGSRLTMNTLGPNIHDRPDLAPSEIEALTPVMYCSCGEQLTLKNDGGQVLDEDDMPQGNIRIIDAIFSAECPNQRCNKVWHCSVGEAVPADGFR